MAIQVDSKFIFWGSFSHLDGKWQGKTFYRIGECTIYKSSDCIPVHDYKESAKVNPSLAIYLSRLLS